jgi:hypothetical protein
VPENLWPVYTEEGGDMPNFNQYYKESYVGGWIRQCVLPVQQCCIEVLPTVASHRAAVLHVAGSR